MTDSPDPGRGGTAPPAPLPIDEVLPEILAAAEAGAAVILAPPGAGKTTRVPQALWDHGLLGDGRCVVLEPRRLAARAAARRVAEERGVEVGREVGYQVRFDRASSATTRILFVTEGILTAWLHRDPALEGVAAVVLDEFHERSLEADLALAFLREVRDAVRPDLKLLVLSATLDPGPVAAYLGARVVVATGRAHPVDVAYRERGDPTPTPVLVADGVRRTWERRPNGRGDLLAFLPGAGEIRRTADRLAPWALERGVRVVPLHGDLPPRRQDEALRAGAKPRVVLATNVAESSVTLEGVSAVVDTGLVKLLRHDPSLGLDRLETVPVGLDSADQRAGRAGRLGPGVALRLWTAHEQRSRRARQEPEVARVDLAGAVLQVIAWGCRDPQAFPWLDAPDPERVEAAVGLLRALGAVDAAGALTPTGRELQRLPIHPRLGRLVLVAAAAGLPREGARLAAVLAERDILLAGRAFGAGDGLPTGASDLTQRLELLAEAAALGFDPAVLEPRGVDAGAARVVWRAAAQLERVVARTAPSPSPPTGDEDALLRLPLAAYPDRVARRRETSDDRFLLVGGRGAVLHRTSAVRRAEFVVAARLDAGRRGPRSESVIRWASAIEASWLEPLETSIEVGFDPAAGRVTAAERTCYRDLVIAERPATPPPEEAHRILAREAARDPLAALRPGREALRLVARCRFLRRERPDLGLPAWDAGDWAALLEVLAWGRISLEELRRADLTAALGAQLTAEQRRALEVQAPTHVVVPSGSRLPLSYPDDGPPHLAVKIQEVFGWTEGPRIAGGRVAVALHLLGPHGRPLQITRDLESFWRHAYPEIRKEMRGRYPKHRWPEDPWAAAPSRRTTKR